MTRKSIFLAHTFLFASLLVGGCATELESEDEATESADAIATHEPGRVFCNRNNNNSNSAEVNYVRERRSNGDVVITSLEIRVKNGERGSKPVFYNGGNKFQLYRNGTKIFTRDSMWSDMGYSVPDYREDKAGNIYRDTAPTFTFKGSDIVKFRAVFNRELATDESCSVTVRASAL